jgi:hypothetical protein
MFKAFRPLPLLALLACPALADPDPAPEPVLLFEVEAAVVEDTQPYAFQVFGDKDTEAGGFTAYGIQVVAPNGELQMLDEFESILPGNSEADALVVEDVNFDGYADVRIMEYLPGGSAVPFFYWLYQPDTGKFARAEEFGVVKSPQVDAENRQLVSRQKVSSSEYVTEFYDPQGTVPLLVRKEVRNYSPDGSSKVHVFVVKEGSIPQLVETRQLGPGEP